MGGFFGLPRLAGLTRVALLPSLVRVLCLYINTVHNSHIRVKLQVSRH
jgi:hypothetical protein